MKHYPKDISGHRAGRLVVIGPSKKKTKAGHYFWWCQCDCGNLHIATKNNLVHDLVKSCGCLAHGQYNKSHGLSQRDVYNTWKNMIDRCYNEDNSAYERYGGRGILVCNRWHDVKNFVYDMGNRPSKKHTLERVNNDLGYSPDNCRWATHQDQARNRRKKSLCSSKSIGVCWLKRKKRWLAYIYVARKRIELGSFHTEEEAIRARSMGEERLWKT